VKNPKEIAATFGNQIRVRVCGILINQEGILLVNHSGLNESGDWWTPPGGGLIFGESLEEALIREFKEETGLVISVAEQLFITEYREIPLHAVEVFFKVKMHSGQLKIGTDPELTDDNQSITAVKFVTFRDLQLMEEKEKHHSLHHISQASDLFDKNGYFPYHSKIDK